MATCGGGGGFDVEFVESLPSNLECPICLLALREPNILSCCGIKVCYSCIDQIRQGQKGCPVCREAEFSTMLEKQLCRLVLGLKVYCHHKEKGCEWIGELRDLDKHLDTGDTTSSCKYVQVICQYGCGKHHARYEIEMHELKECSKRPLETQVYQMHEMVESIKKEHDLEIKEMKSMIDNQNNIITLLKIRVDTLEKKSATWQSNTGSLPPPIAPPLPPPIAPPLIPPLAPPLLPPLAPPPPPIQFGNASIPTWSQGVPPPPPPLPFLSSRVPPPRAVPRPPFLPPRSLPVSLPSHRLIFNNETTFTFQGSRKVCIIKDDICLQNTDVIVTSASPSMRHTSGVSLALNRASNGTLQRNSNKLLLHSGDLTHGDVVSIEAGGRLICSHVVYAIPPHSMPSSISIPNGYAPLISKSLDKVNSLNAKSVAFVAIGMYGREKRADGVASALLKAIVSYDYSTSKLTDIRIVLIDSKVYKVFVDVLKAKRFLETNPTTTTRNWFFRNYN